MVMLAAITGETLVEVAIGKTMLRRLNDIMWLQSYINQAFHFRHHSYPKLLHFIMEKSEVHKGRDFGTGLPSEGRMDSELRSTHQSSETQERGRYQGTGVPKHMMGDLDQSTQLKGSKDTWPKEDKEQDQSQ